MSDQVDEVKAKTDIVSVVGESVKLNKAGSNYKGLCPFHSEKTPSFMVSPELQIYKCFGCGESGDVISFLQKYEGMEFYEALKMLADKAGIKLKPIKTKDSSEKQKLIEINEQSVNFYHYILTKHEAGKKALDYLVNNRRLNKESIETFKLGYAPDTGSPLANFLIKKKGFSESDIERAGVSGKGKYGIYDRFGGRVIFPLYDHRGNAIGLAGRILPGGRENRAKYINSPETLIYKKSKTLFGFNVTRGDIKRRGKAILVEGELDMISSWQAGVKNVVAIKGTALTEEQIDILARITEELIFALDADFAGDSAARRGITMAQNAGMDVSVAKMGKYKDPDEFAQNDPTGYVKALRDTVDVWDFYLHSIAKKYDLESGNGKARFSREIVPILVSIRDKIVQAHYVGETAKLLRVPDEAVVQQMERYGRNERKAPEIATMQKTGEKEEKERPVLLEEDLLSIIFQSDFVKVDIKKVVEFLDSPVSIKLLDHLNRFQDKNDSYDKKAFSESLPAELKDGFAALVMRDMDEDLSGIEFYKRVQEILAELWKLKMDKLKREKEEEMRRLQENGNKDDLEKAAEEFTELVKKRFTLEIEEIKSIIHM